MNLGMSSMKGKSRDFWKVNWIYTFYKNSELAIEPKIKPWNILSISLTYKYLQNNDNYINFVSCFKELIPCLKSFYANIDDVSNYIFLMNKADEACFAPGYIQQIFWGNFFGAELCEKYGIIEIGDIPCQNKEKIYDGLFVGLTDNVLDFKSSECEKNRGIMRKYLKIKKALLG